MFTFKAFYCLFKTAFYFIRLLIKLLTTLAFGKVSGWSNGHGNQHLYYVSRLSLSLVLSRKLTTIGFVTVLKLTRVSRVLNSLQVHYRRIKIIYTYICISMYMSECSSNAPSLQLRRDT